MDAPAISPSPSATVISRTVLQSSELDDPMGYEQIDRGLAAVVEIERLLSWRRERNRKLGSNRPIPLYHGMSFPLPAQGGHSRLCMQQGE